MITTSRSAVSTYSVIQRYFSYVSIPTSLDACWLWTGNLNIHNGYGRLKVGGKHIVASRIAWLMWQGEIPEGMNVLHHCDVMHCVNPRHLFLGTLSDNAFDREAKGRGHNAAPRGTAHWNAKLTLEAVEEIRSSALSGYALAAKFGVRRGTIYAVRGGARWVS